MWILPIQIAPITKKVVISTHFSTPPTRVSAYHPAQFPVLKSNPLIVFCSILCILYILYIYITVLYSNSPLDLGAQTAPIRPLGLAWPGLARPATPLRSGAPAPLRSWPPSLPAAY
jgi:hypothetical protein